MQYLHQLLCGKWAISCSLLSSSLGTLMRMPHSSPSGSPAPASSSSGLGAPPQAASSLAPLRRFLDAPLVPWESGWGSHQLRAGGVARECFTGAARPLLAPRPSGPEADALGGALTPAAGARRRGFGGGSPIRVSAFADPRGSTPRSLRTSWGQACRPYLTIEPCCCALTLRPLGVHFLVFAHSCCCVAVGEGGCVAPQPTVPPGKRPVMGRCSAAGQRPEASPHASRSAYGLGRQISAVGVHVHPKTNP